MQLFSPDNICLDTKFQKFKELIQQSQKFWCLNSPPCANTAQILQGISWCLPVQGHQCQQRAETQSSLSELNKNWAPHNNHGRGKNSISSKYTLLMFCLCMRNTSSSFSAANLPCVRWISAKNLSLLLYPHRIQPMGFITGCNTLISFNETLPIAPGNLHRH